MARIVELRIHGVSGTPPQDMLQQDPAHPLAADDVVQVAGDAQTGFFQLTSDRGPTGPTDPDHLLEAYNWGQLTSGSWTKSLWLVLVPFGMVNAAHFMLPRSDNKFGSACRILSEAMLRLIGLILSVVLTLATSEVLVDLIAWQWTGLHAKDSTVARYADPRGWLLAALIATGLVPLLMFLFGGRRTPSAGEPVAPTSPDNPLAAFTGMAASPSTNPMESVATEFDIGDPDIPTLTKLHLGASGAVLGWTGFSLFSASSAPPTGALEGWIYEHGTGLCTILLAIIAVAVVLIGNPHHDTAGWRRRSVRILGFAGVIAGAVLWIAGAVAVIGTEGIKTGDRGVLPGVGQSTHAVMLTGLVAIGLLALCCAGVALAGALPTRRKLAPPGPFRRYLAGMTSPVMASLGVFLGVGFGSAAVFGVKHLLLATVGPGQDLVLPTVYRRVAHAWGLTVLEILLLAGLGSLVWLRQKKQFVEGVRRAHNVDPYLPDLDPVPTPPMTDTSGLRHADDLTPSMVSQIAFGWWTARIKMHIQWIACALSVTGVILTLLTVIASRRDSATECAQDGPSTWRSLGWLVSCQSFGGTALVGIGSLALLGLFLGLVYVGRKSLEDASTRRSLNVVWDVIAFWPRAAHPLVPPPYTAKALDQLRRRIYYYLALCPSPEMHDSGAACDCAKFVDPDDPTRRIERVLLAPHSQGNMLAVAAIAGLRLSGSGSGSTGRAGAVRFDQLALLTYGSQLQFAYARGFPRYANIELIQGLLSGLDPCGTGTTGWISLMRETDPIGGQVLSDRRTMTAVPPQSFRLESSGMTAGPVTDLVEPGGVRRCGREWRLLDPVPTDGETAPRRRMLRHSSYFLDPAWCVATGLLAGGDIGSQIRD
jgi:hypothetical protein